MAFRGSLLSFTHHLLCFLMVCRWDLVENTEAKPTTQPPSSLSWVCFLLSVIPGTTDWAGVYHIRQMCFYCGRCVLLIHFQFSLIAPHKVCHYCTVPKGWILYLWWSLSSVGNLVETSNSNDQISMTFMRLATPGSCLISSGIHILHLCLQFIYNFYL